MKKLSPFLLSHSVDKCVHHMVKFNNTLLASFPEAESTPNHLNEVEFLKGNYKCAEYLRCGISSVKKLKQKGIISSFKEGNYSWFRISDIVAARELHPEAFNFRVYSTPPKRTYSPILFTKCYTSSKDVMFINLTYQGWKCTICSTPAIVNDQPAIFTLCENVIRLYHKFRPFVIKPM